MIRRHRGRDCCTCRGPFDLCGLGSRLAMVVAMSRSLWPHVVPEPFRDAAGGLMAERPRPEVADGLRVALGLSQLVVLGPEDLQAAVVAAEEDPSLFEQLAIEFVLFTARQLRHQYPSSSLVWDRARDELRDLLGANGFTPGGVNRWLHEVVPGRTVVIELTPSFAGAPDERSFALRWGVVLERLSFCRHQAGACHRLACCAVVGGMGAVAPPFGDHLYTVGCGVLVERRGPRALRVVGREGFRSGVHRLANFCLRMTERERLVEVVSDRPWRLGIGVASRLREASHTELLELLP